MNDINTILSIFSVTLTIASIIGGFYAFKTSLSRTANEVQEHVINALNQEISVLRGRLDDLEKENKKLNQVIVTICEALKRRGLIVTIEGNLVTLTDGKNSQTARIQEV
jgi:3-dehydroquinate dehydratase